MNEHSTFSGFDPEWNPNTSLTIGIAGGSGAGKTTVAQAIRGRLGKRNVAYIPHDAYYRDQSHLPPDQHNLINFDHPDVLDTDLFIDHICRLQNGLPVDIPIYDFTTHSRSNEVHHVLPQRVILVEGILIFTEARIRELLDLRLFVDADADIRFIRRLQRDMCERGRTLESVTQQWLQTVRPSHLEFVEMSKRHAHIMIPESGLNENVLNMIVGYVGEFLRAERAIYTAYFL